MPRNKCRTNLPCPTVTWSLEGLPDCCLLSLFSCLPSPQRPTGKTECTRRLIPKETNVRVLRHSRCNCYIRMNKLDHRTTISISRPRFHVDKLMVMIQIRATIVDAILLKLFVVTCLRLDKKERYRI